MSRARPLTWGFWILLMSLTGGVAYLIHNRLTGETIGIELIFAWCLLLVNALFFLAAHLFTNGNDAFSSPAVALGGFGLKLFVNTFTIFIFIGLHAGRTHVFVWQFFGAYTLLLFGSVLLLTRKP